MNERTRARLFPRLEQLEDRSVPTALPVTFTLDPAHSILNASGQIAAGSFGTFNLQQQGPGSLITNISGAIKTSLDLSTQKLSLVSGTTLDAAVSGNWQPAAGGASGSAAADLGGKIDAGGAGSVQVAVRGVVATLANVTFNLSGSSTRTFTPAGTFVLDAGKLDYRPGGLASAFLSAGSKDLTAGHAVNQSATKGKLVDLGNGQLQLQLPINVTLATKVGNNNATLTLIGTLTALANHAPVIAVPGAQHTLQGVPVAFAAATHNAVTLGDSDGDSQALDLTASHGKLTLSTTSGLTVTGNGTAHVTASGSLAKLNAALVGMLFTPDADFKGGALITLSTSDGRGGTASKPIRVVVGNDVTLRVLNAAARTEGAAGTTTNAVFPLRLSGKLTTPLVVSYTPHTGTADANDFDTTAGTVTIPAGQTKGQITVPIKGDNIDEPNETFTVGIAANVPGLSIETDTASCKINDDDPRPSMRIAGARVTEGNSGTSNLVFKVTLSAPSGFPITISYLTAGGSGITGATPNVDFVSASGTLTFKPGQTKQTITVKVKGDTAVELDELLSVHLSHIKNASLAVGTATGTIVNDDIIF